MQPGIFNHYVEVQKKKTVKATDDSGDRTTEYVTEFPVYADKVALSVRDFVASRANQSAISEKFQIRFTDIPIGINWLDYRLLCDGVYYRIIGPLSDNKGGNNWVTLACESGVTVWQDLP